MARVYRLSFVLLALASGLVLAQAVFQVGAAPEAEAVWFVDHSQDDGLVGWWTFDEGNPTNLADASLYRNHGTLAGTLAYTTGVPPAIQFTDPRAGTFSGDDWVTVAEHSSLDLEQALTMAVWLKTPDPYPDQKIMGKVDLAGSGAGYLMGIGSGTGYIVIWGSTGTVNIHVGTIPADTWTHLAVTWQTGGDMVTYVDGAAVDTQPAPGTITTNDNPLRIGVAPWDTGYFHFVGDLDDARLYNRALTADEIAALAAGGDHDGGSWDDPFTTVQRALTNAQPGDEIWVAHGLYTPTLPQNAGDPRTATFRLPPGVTTYGHFAGTESAVAARDLGDPANRTVLSGDLDHNDTTDSSGVVTDPANIQGSNSYHVVWAQGGTPAMSLDGVTLTAGQANGGYPNDRGGGVYVVDSSTTLSLTHSTLTGNAATFYGGGLYNGNGTVTVSSSTLSGNTANYGGGLYSNTASGDCNAPAATLIRNSTLSGNTASFQGGGIYNYLGVTEITYSTITANTAPADAGGGMWSFNDDWTCTRVGSSILAGNHGSDVAAYDSPTQRFASLGYNRVGTAGANVDFAQEFNAPGDQTGVTDPGLASLAGNGGPTWTHALLPGSPALNAGDNASCPDTDQRGLPRPQNGVCDIGAFELGYFSLAVEVAGSGEGSVVSDPAGIDCGSTCTSNYLEGTAITLTATAGLHSSFTGWSGAGSGACSGTEACVVTMTEAKTVTATLTLVEYKLYLPLVIQGL